MIKQKDTSCYHFLKLRPLCHRLRKLLQQHFHVVAHFLNAANKNLPECVLMRCIFFKTFSCSITVAIRKHFVGHTSSAQSDVDIQVTSQLAASTAAAKNDIVEATRRRRQRGLASVAASGSVDPQSVASPEQQPITSQQQQQQEEAQQSLSATIDQCKYITKVLRYCVW